MVARSSAGSQLWQLAVALDATEVTFGGQHPSGSLALRLFVG